MRWLHSSLGLSGSRPWRAVVGCCIALFALSATSVAHAQSGPSDSEWFDANSDEPQYWSGAPPAADPAYAADDSEPADDEGAPPPGDTRDEQARNERAVQEFSPHLAPYGVWVDDGVYGRVWVPNARVVGPGFAPYVSGGHWELTVNDDWLWVSDYPFGWVAFHYGRWVWLPTARWAWVPGYRYAPAWVDFRVASPGVAYVGWGPSRPTYVWRNGLFVSFTTAVSVPYVFCPSDSVFSVSVNRYIVRDRYRVRELSRDTYAYRTRRYYGGSYVRAPSVHEARIPERYVPRQRVIGRPQSVSQRERSERRFLSSPVPQRSYGDQRRSNAGAGRSSPGYVQRDRDRGRDGFQRRDRDERRDRDAGARPPTWNAPNQNRQYQNRPNQHRQYQEQQYPNQRRSPSPTNPGRNRTYTPPAQREPQGTTAQPAQRGRMRDLATAPNSAPRVDDRHRATRRYEGNTRSNDGAARPPPAAYQRRDTGNRRAATAPRRTPRADSTPDNGSSSGTRPAYRGRGDSRH